MFKGITAIVVALLLPMTVVADHETYSFVGFSTGMASGDGGIANLNQLCQDDFGDTARFATTREYILSPNASVPTSDAWVHRALDGDFEIEPLTPAGKIVRANCMGWSATSVLPTGLAVRRPRGGFLDYSCDTVLTVACSDVIAAQPYHFVGFSAETRQGHTGFPAMHAACQAAFGSEARMATDLEYLQAATTDTPSAPAWIMALFIDGRSVSNGAPEPGINNNQPDCRSWSLRNPVVSGTAVNTAGGFIRASCGGIRPVACSAP